MKHNAQTKQCQLAGEGKRVRGSCRCDLETPEPAEVYCISDRVSALPSDFLEQEQNQRRQSRAAKDSWKLKCLFRQLVIQFAGIVQNFVNKLLAAL